MIKSITIGSLTIGREQANFFLHDAVGFESPDIRLAAFNLPGQHGAKFSNALWGKRVMRIEGRVMGATAAAYQTNRQTVELNVDLRDGLRLMQFTMENADAWQAYIILSSPIEMAFRRGQMTFADFRLELTAFDPNFYSQTEHDQSIAKSATETINNAGNTETYPTVIINGPIATSATLNNTTTGESATFTIALGGGDHLDINFKERTVVKDDTTNQYSSFSGDWWELAAGNNSIQLTTGDGGDTGNAVVYWRDAVIGV